MRNLRLQKWKCLFKIMHLHYCQRGNENSGLLTSRSVSIPQHCALEAQSETKLSLVL